MLTYLPESNSYICPAGQQLNYGGRNEGNRTFGYIGTRKKCGPCQQRSQCTTGPFRYLAIHMNEAARQRARDLWMTTEFEHAQRQRKKVEALFAQLKSSLASASIVSALTSVEVRSESSSSLQPPPRTSSALVRFLSRRPHAPYLLPLHNRRWVVPPRSYTASISTTRKREEFFNTHAPMHSEK